MVNGDKRNDLGKKIRVWLPVVLVLATIISGGVAFQVKSQNNEEAIEENKVEIKENGTDIQSLKTDVAVIKKDVKYMRGDMVEVKTSIKEMRTEQNEQKVILYKILGKLE